MITLLLVPPLTRIVLLTGLRICTCSTSVSIMPPRLIALNTVLSCSLHPLKARRSGIATINISRVRCQATTPCVRQVFTQSFFPSTNKNVIRSTALIGLTVSTLLASLWQISPVPYVEALPREDVEESYLPEEKRTIRLAELRDHGQHAKRPWVTKGTSVYDITDLVSSHPGGDIILQAAGGSVEPYWQIFTFHQTQDVYNILEDFRIGSIDPQDLRNGQMHAHTIVDPFAQDPTRDARLQIHTDKPCNAETPPSELSSFVTPNSIFYVRNHFWVPALDEKSHKLVIELSDGIKREYTMEELKTKFKQFKITATLQCSGNRRKHMTEGARPAKGLQWKTGAIGNAEWSGPRLCDVLADAGLSLNNPPEDAKHVQFVGAESYGVSIPLCKAIENSGDVLLACQMNDEAIPPDHGHPLRLIVPGYVAARSVKWVNRIIVSNEESKSQWQKLDYKCFGPNDDSKPNWARATAIQEMPVQSAITLIRDRPNSDDQEPSLIIEGYAYSGGGRAIVRVDISTNDGKTWDQAGIDEDVSVGCKNWSWRRWRHTVPKKSVGPSIVVKAVDEAYNTQPERYEPIYNLRGHLTSAWHRVPYKAQ